jgi:heme-degrading monooxygenase HmoA
VLPGGGQAPSEESRKTAEQQAKEAASVPGSEQIISLLDTDSGEGLVIHLWQDRASYDAFTDGRAKITSAQQGSGTKISAGRIYDVTIRT